MLPIPAIREIVDGEPCMRPATPFPADAARIVQRGDVYEIYTVQDLAEAAPAPEEGA